MQSDALYEEILWYESNKQHECRQIPWARYWHHLLVSLIEQNNRNYDASAIKQETCNLTSIFEIFVCGEKQAVRLACVMNTIENKQIQPDESGMIIVKLAKTDAQITVDCTIQGQPRVENEYFVLSLRLQVFNYAQTTENMTVQVKFPENCYTELLEQNL